MVLKNQGGAFFFSKKTVLLYCTVSPCRMCSYTPCLCLCEKYVWLQIFPTLTTNFPQNGSKPYLHVAVKSGTTMCMCGNSITLAAGCHSVGQRIVCTPVLDSKPLYAHQASSPLFSLLFFLVWFDRDDVWLCGVAGKLTASVVWEGECQVVWSSREDVWLCGVAGRLTGSVMWQGGCLGWCQVVWCGRDGSISKALAWY